MAVEPIINIDVDDAKFARFQELFTKYQTQLGKMPNAWKEAGKHTSALASQFERMAAALMAQSHLSKETEKSEDRQVKTLTRSERLWVSMSHATKSVAGHILGATASLMRWTGIVSTVSGLLGMGGLWGIDRMAADVSGQRRSSMGLGMSIGQQRSFDINMGRFVDPHAYLSGVNDAVSDVSRQGPLYSLGVDPNGSTAQVSISLMKAVRARLRSMPRDQVGLFLQQYGLGAFGYSTESAMRLRSASDSEFNSQLRHTATDATSLNISSGTALGWQNFTSQMERAGATIFRIFVTGLAPLATPLNHLSHAIIGLLTRVMDKGPLTKEIDAVASWINDLSGKLAKPAFLTKVDRFTTDLGSLGDAVHKVVWAAHHPLKAAAKGTWDVLKGAAYDEWRGISEVGSTILGYGRKQDLLSLERQYHLPPGTLAKQWMAESSDSLDNNLRSKKGARGPFQIMPKVGAQYHVDWNSWNSQADVAAQIDAKNLHRFGSIRKAIAAYNAGAGGVSSAIHHALLARSHNWASYLPAETQGYLAKQGFSVSVVNKTGSDTIASITGLAPVY